MNLFRTVLQPAALITAALLSLAAPAQAQHAGYRTFTIAGDVPATYADVADLMRDTGFKPATSIETGIARFVQIWTERLGSPPDVQVINNLAVGPGWVPPVDADDLDDLGDDLFHFHHLRLRCGATRRKDHGGDHQQGQHYTDILTGHARFLLLSVF